MDWITRLTDAMAYIEGNLREEIDWNEAARRALCSSYEFARMFALMAEIPLSEYVRRRRLTLAAQDLQVEGAKVLDVALQYGYASPTAFQRAFAQYHGVTPSQVRKLGVRLQSYPPISFHLRIQGGIALQYRLEERPAFQVVGYREEVSLLNGENFVRIPKMWEEMTEDKFQRLEAYKNGQLPGILGVMDCGGESRMEYIIAVPTDRQDPEADMFVKHVPAATYAVFETPLSEIQATTKRIYGEWMPGSIYEHDNTPEFEYYPDGDMSDETKYICEIWIPVRKKK